MNPPSTMAPSSSFEPVENLVPTVAVIGIPLFGGDKVPTNEGPVFPAIGDDFLNFRLVAELGRGAFGRVYLALQSDLANRRVALKISNELFDETQTLAQLQHTNIVPIYSAHRVGQLQAVCMPFFGSTTLADVVNGLRKESQFPTTGRHIVTTIESRSTSHLLDEHDNGRNQFRRLDVDSNRRPSTAVAEPTPRSTFELLSRYSFVEAVLWLGARLAEALTHAHERGIIHRDIKPANVLMADDGRPMLLDFNLSINPSLQSTVRGGTVPYMAPEQFRSDDADHPPIDGRADVYALGLILYELLTGRSPFPRHKGPASEIVPKILAERLQPLPRMKPLNAAVTPAIEAIVQKCLAFHPVERYPSAQALRDDLERQLANRPLQHISEPSIGERLKKWSRRHPRWSSAGTLSIAAGLVVALLGYGLWSARAENRRRTAFDQYQLSMNASDELRDRLIRVNDSNDGTVALLQVRELARPYRLSDRNSWQTDPAIASLPPHERTQLRHRLGELLLLAAAQERQSDQNGDFRSYQELHDWAGNCFDDSEKPLAWWRQQVELANKNGDIAKAAAARQVLDSRPPVSATDFYLYGLTNYQGGRFAAAADELEQAVRLDLQHYWAWVLLGNCRYMLNQDAEAVTACSVALGINNRNSIPYHNRGLALFRLGRYASALADFEEAARHGHEKPESVLQQVKCLVGMSRTGRGDTRQLDEAEKRLTQLIDRGELELRAYHARADIRRRKRDRVGATADTDKVAQIQPVTAADFIARGLSRKAADPKGALADYQAATKLNPSSIAAWQNQANVLSENLNRPEEALAALDRVILIAPEFPPALGGRAIILARLGRTDEAVKAAEGCLARFDHPFISYQMAGVYALTADRPGHLTRAVQLIAGAIQRNAALAERMADDRDLKPIVASPEFRKLREATAVLRGYD